MGYYSELTIDETYREDRSYPSPELQLKWRIEDLRSRLEDVSTGKFGILAHQFMVCRYSKDDLANTSPEYFSRESDIMDAIAIAEERLKLMETEKFEILLETKKAGAEGIPEQLSFWDILEKDVFTIMHIVQHEQAA